MMTKLERLERATAEEAARLAKLDPSGMRLSRADLERLERAVASERQRIWDDHGAAVQARRNAQRM